MSDGEHGVEGANGGHGVAARLRAVAWGREDTRVRATYRVLLAMPLFWVVGGGVFAGQLQTSVGVIPLPDEPLGGVAFSLLHGGFVLVALAAWARFLDRRPLSAYGVSATPEWLTDVLVGMSALFLAFVLWFAVGVATGWATVDVAMSAPTWPLPVAVALFVVALGIHVWIQQVVFFRIVAGNAAEGLHARGLTPARAAGASLFVAVPIFVAVHGPPPNLDLLDLTLVGLVYGLLYVHTGELALGIGLHLGVFLADQVVFVSAGATADGAAILAVTQSLPGALSVLGAYGFPKMLLGYGFLLAYLVWREREVPVEPDVARWTPGDGEAR